MSINGSATAMAAALGMCASQQIIPVGIITTPAQQRTRRAVLLASSFIHAEPLNALVTGLPGSYSSKRHTTILPRTTRFLVMYAGLNH
jgi:hypothetical protein